MKLFYTDAKLELLEEKLDFLNALKYLEKVFEQENTVQALNSLIFAAWHYYIEGDVNQKPLTYDWKYFRDMWKKYIDLGHLKYNDNDSFCLISGYTLLLNGIDLGSLYEKNGIESIKKCYEKTSDENLKLLASYFLRKSDKEFKYWENLKQLKVEIFNDKSLSSKYFNEIILKK